MIFSKINRKAKKAILESGLYEAYEIFENISKSNFFVHDRLICD